jgi:hypothetical protein
MTGNHEVAILDRQTLERYRVVRANGEGRGGILERSGTPDPHYVASDSKGNLYTAGGFRVQTFVYKGTGESRR